MQCAAVKIKFGEIRDPPQTWYQDPPTRFWRETCQGQRPRCESSPFTTKGTAFEATATGSLSLSEALSSDSNASKPAFLPISKSK